MGIKDLITPKSPTSPTLMAALARVLGNKVVKILYRAEREGKKKHFCQQHGRVFLWLDYDVIKIPKNHYKIVVTGALGLSKPPSTKSGKKVGFRVD